MSIFKCKHKEYRVEECKKNSKEYTVKCIKCGLVWKLPKAEGEIYDTYHIIRRG